MPVPKYAGMSGTVLSRTISAVATTGFLLFGYDRASGPAVRWQVPELTLVCRGYHERYHQRSTIQQCLPSHKRQLDNARYCNCNLRSRYVSLL